MTPFLGGAGLIISWVAFWGVCPKEGPDIGGFGSNALTQLGLKGLTYDLVACGAIPSTRTLSDLKRLGASRVAAICLTTWIRGHAEVWHSGRTGFKTGQSASALLPQLRSDT